ncbi:MAG: alpha/beta hydrolase [Muribaculum sp.]|nr:alpha/beta hydrolase [Muribaculaceae bacterium]MCM1080548.1 alpha/beta hydrolase [Muribaculum sp.]
MEEKFINSQGCRVRYTISGKQSGPWLVLMHGWGCKAETLASVGAVAEASHRVLSLDFPGHGGSDEPSQVWGVEQYTRVLSDIIEAEQIVRPVLLGHSFGGRVGIFYASMNPEKVDKLILVDAAGIKPRRKPIYYFKVYTFKTMKFLINRMFSKEKAEKILNARRAKAGSADYASASPMMRAILSRIVNEDLKSYMPAIKAPTLLIWGENDTATPLSDAKYMERHIPDAGLVSFPGCGHYSFLDNPGQFAAVVRSFLNS